MPAPDSTKVQINYKAGDALINVYADTPDELVNILTALESLAGTISTVDGLIKAAYNTGPVAAPPSQVPSAQAPNQGWNTPATHPVQPGGYAAYEQQAQQGPPPAWAQGPAQGGYAQQPPAAGPGKTCRHGAMQYREGVGKQSGKPYKAWFCPSRDRQDQCDAEFVR